MWIPRRCAPRNGNGGADAARFGAFLKSEIGKWAAVIKAARITEE